MQTPREVPTLPTTMPAVGLRVPAPESADRPAVTPDQNQRDVIEAAVCVRQLVLAGPGSGKTEVSARRISHLLGSGLGAGNILVLSFSRSAVRTLRERLSRAPGLEPHVLEELRHVSVRTFDSWAFRMLRVAGHDPADLLRDGHDDNIALLARTIRTAPPDELRAALSGIRHVLIDEVQDLAGVRGDLMVDLLELLASPHKEGVGFTLLGDGAQAIYGFSVRNAPLNPVHGVNTAHLITGLRRAYGTQLRERRLDRNYRAGAELAKLMETMRELLMVPGAAADKLVAVQAVLSALPDMSAVLDNPAEAIAVFSSVAILARTNGEVLQIARKIMGTDDGGPGYSVLVGSGGQASGAPAWVAALLAPLRATVLTRQQFNTIHARAAEARAVAGTGLPPVATAWAQLAGAVRRDAATMSITVRDLANSLAWPDAFPDDEGLVSGKLCVSTIHQSKGKEFDLVAILEPDPNQHHEDQDDEEEACIGFVALSRAIRGFGRLPRSAIYAPPASREFRSNRTRLVSWAHGWVNMEMGILGDIEPSSFVDVDLHGSAEAVLETQTILARDADQLNGHKVVLKKVPIPGAAGRRVRYEIWLQDGGRPSRLLGAMSDNVVMDLLHFANNRWNLPGRIMNLRISGVRSLSSFGREDDSTAQGLAPSGMWLGVHLFGTGDFKTSK